MALSKESLLLELLSQPTAPFREGHVIDFLTKTFQRNRIPYFTDPTGNLIVGVNSKKQYLERIKRPHSEPLRLFIAHLDHPGFHGVRWTRKNELEVQWHGGTPTQHLEGARVWLSTPAQPGAGIWKAEGILSQVTLSSSGKSIAKGHVQFLDQPPQISPQKLFGGFRFRAPVWTEGDLIYTHAADDLIGAFAILTLALEQKKNKNWVGILTRAEEVGFIGALAHLELGWLKKTKRPLLAISLETSRTLPGAEIGKGPIVRLGDRFTGFDPGATAVLTQIAESLLPGAYQRRIMDGGSCEATAATVYGIKSIGISVPLGNYHNQSLEGGPDSAPHLGPAPEWVNTQDVQGVLTLCKGLIQNKLPWHDPWAKKKKELQKLLKNYQRLLNI